MISIDCFLQGIRDIFKQLLEKVQTLSSHTPIQDMEKVFKFYTVFNEWNLLNVDQCLLACCSDYESRE